jgi:beta-glucanase (GH16 family)
MKKILVILFTIGAITASSQTVNPYLPDTLKPQQINGMTLVFNEEFNNTGKPNSANWSYEGGFVRNSELQWYQSDNANCSGGRLLIEGRRANFPNPKYVAGSTDWRTNRQTVNYTSSCIHSRGKKSWLFGRFEIRARIDTTKGAWPAIWTLGNTKDWPSCGEIDIMEFYRINDIQTLLANVAWGTATAWQAKWDSYTRPLSQILAVDAHWPEKYHVWRMDWTSESIKLYVDNEPYNMTLLSQTINADGSNPFLQPQYMMLNLALGSGGGDPSKSVFPLEYEVDYFRVYQNKTTDLNNQIVNESEPYIVYPINNKIVRFQYPKAIDNIPMKVSVYNVSGVNVFSHNFNNIEPQNELNLSFLNSGIYFIRFNGQHSKVCKFILK